MSTAKTVGIVVLALAALAAGGYGVYKVVELKKERDLLKSKLAGLEAIFKPFIPNGVGTSNLATDEDRTRFLIDNAIAVNSNQSGLDLADVRKVISEHQPAYDLLVNRLTAAFQGTGFDVTAIETHLEETARQEPTIMALLSAMGELVRRVPGEAIAVDVEDEDGVTARAVLTSVPAANDSAAAA